MKEFFQKRHTILLLLLTGSSIFGMQQSQQSVFRLNEGASNFNVLSTDLNCLLVAQLPPKDKNALRSACKAFSNFLSFCNACRFILYPGFCAANKDISSIFAVSTFDKNYRLVEGLCNKYGPHDYNYGCIERKCRFVGIDSRKFMCLDRKNELVISPYSIACNNNDTNMIELLKKYRFTSNETSLSTTVALKGMSKIFNLLIACISRNTERIIESMQHIMFIGPNTIGTSLAVIIDNDDAQSLAAIMHEEKIKLYIENNGFDLLNLAIFGKHQKVAETLISSKHFDFNAKRHILSVKFGNEENTIFKGTYLDFLNCCRELSNIDQSVFSLLAENGAKASEDPIIDFEAITSFIKNAWDDFVWSSLLNTQ